MILSEAAVQSFKGHFRKVVGETRLVFEELTTITAQIKECLNSRPLTPLPEASETWNHDVPILWRWRLCQAIICHFWRRWLLKCLFHLQRFGKWNVMACKFRIGDIVCVREESLFPTRWPLARVIQIHPGQDGKVQVVTIQMPTGTCKRLVVKILLVCEDWGKVSKLILF